MCRDDSEIRLAEGALLYAQDHYPQLNVACWLNRCDQLGERVRQLGARTPAERIEAMRQVLIEEEDFSANVEDYYDARNSFLNEVLHRRLGIPISLSLIWLDVARQLGWPLVGVGLPGHFIVKYVTDDIEEDLLIDPFHGGCLLTIEDCETLILRSCGQCARLRRCDLRPACNKGILTRMLNNLRVIFIQQQAWVRAAQTVDRLLAIHPKNADLHYERKNLVRQLARMN